MDFLKLAQGALANVAQNGQNGGGSVGQIPDMVLTTIDRFLDDLKPTLEPEIKRHIGDFQSSALNQLEREAISIFEKIFDLDGSGTVGTGQRPGSRAIGEPGERGFTEFAQSVAGAFNKLDDKLDDFGDRLGDKLEEGLQKMFDPKEKAEKYVPVLKEKVRGLLDTTHDGLSARFSDVVISRTKEYLRANITTADVTKLGMDNIGSLASSFLSGIGGHSSSREVDLNSQSRGMDFGGGQDRGIDFNQGLNQGVEILKQLLSAKVQGGVKEIRAKSKENLHKEIMDAEGKLWQSLPENIRTPLEAILGGNPTGGSGSRGLMDSVSGALGEVIEKLQTRIFEQLKSILSLGHGTLEDRAIKTVEEVIMAKVRQFIPNAQLPA